MASFNRVILLGNLTRDPEIKYIPSGMAVCDLGLAVNDRVKNAAGEWVEQTTFVDVTLWGRTAEVASEYLSKGSPILVEGRLKLDTWQSTDGQKKSKLRVVCEKMQMVGPRPEGGKPGGARPAPRQQQRPRGPGGEYGQDAPPDDFGAPPPHQEADQGVGGGDDIPF